MELDRALEYATDTQQFLVGEVLDRIPSVFRDCFPEGRAVVVADDNTFAAAGKQVHELLEASGLPTLEPYVYPGRPTLVADDESIGPLRDHLSSTGAIPVAVGSGTLNDIAKTAAFEAGSRYISVATAASVDGYSSPGASVVRDGFKQTAKCLAPIAIIADVATLRSAPLAMTAAGYADLSSKITGGTDWIIADGLGIDPIDSVCWELVQTDLASWLAEPERVVRGDGELFEGLFFGLTMTGIGMQYLRRSRPASGSEHLMSHIWEMRHLSIEGEPVSHGFKVAIGTLICTALTECVFRRGIDDLDFQKRLETWPSFKDRADDIRRVMDPLGVAESAVEESRAKYIDVRELGERLVHLSRVWSDMKDRIGRRLVPYSELRDRFARAACPTTARDVGLEREDAVRTITAAGMIRNRYTILDLAYELGILEECMEEILASDVYLG